MPYTHLKSYQVSWPLSNGHLHSFAAYFRGGVPKVNYTRVRYSTPDQDFIDIDYLKNGSKKICILFHGLEGNSESKYVRRIAQNHFSNNWDIAAFNYRGCSGEDNRHLHSYHSGATDDIHYLLPQIVEGYDEISLIGFSLGANLLLKYLGELGKQVDPRISTAVAISVPCHLASCSKYLSGPGKGIYQYYFLRSLKAKVADKYKKFPNQISLKHFAKIKNLWDFDDHYTAPINGFSSAQDYYDKSSSLGYLPLIEVKTLIINSYDDPFLDPNTHPIEEVKQNPSIHLIMTDYGGHVGFIEGRGYISDRLMDSFIHDPYSFEYKVLNFQTHAHAR